MCLASVAVTVSLALQTSLNPMVAVFAGRSNRS